MKKVIAALFICLIPLVAISAAKNITFSDNEKVMVKHLFKYDIQKFINSDAHMFSYTTLIVSAEKIAADYDANEARGDRDYKGKPIVISGTVEKIRSTMGDVPAVELKTNVGVHGVSLYFTKENENLAIDLNKGDKVSYACIGDGSVLGDPVLRGCMPTYEYVDAASDAMYKDTMAMLKDIKDPNSEANSFVLFTKMITRLTDEYKLCSATDAKCIVNIIDTTPMEKRKAMAREMSQELGVNVKVK
ncbi:OB-fold putative lipoprotein [Citrobacter portucalensis]|uniref:OB-fold putative lipoprotein n=1 Tax=Citrobacter portucalensis TaxID=1639133 RepID=A0AAW5WD90_9ENTR|nr:hypothetical protein [Citrobacter portucalensis]MCX9004317.1 OB-fold putative lipoprotein [Citrobacter portucalensis]